MKKIKFYFVLIIGIITLITSCFSTRELTVDKNNPANNNVIIKFYNDKHNRFSITKWNDTDIVKSLYGSKIFAGNGDKIILTIPSGANRITFDLILNYHNKGRLYAPDKTLRIENIEVQYDFESGKEYEIKCRSTWYALLSSSAELAELSIEIYDRTPISFLKSNNILLKKWNIVEKKVYK